MRGGQIIAEGDPSDIVTATLVAEVFGLQCRVIDDPETGTPLVIPARRRAASTVARDNQTDSRKVTR